jgi:hypothetical protein
MSSNRRVVMTLLLVLVPGCGSCDDSPRSGGSGSPPNVSWDGGGIRSLRPHHRDTGAADAAPD